ncbi:MAG: PLDc N-terminal domain-containing protein, partial [Microlunatus sp.]|nr:PLDc N-terminal domain-containing protein [Microlunatus sp.]
MGDVVRWLIFAAEIIIVFVVALYVSANRRPSSAIAWILVFILLPVLGIVAFLLVGVGRLPRSRRAKQREVSDAIMARTDRSHDVEDREDWPRWLPATVRMNRALGALPMIGGNQVELIEDYDGSIKEMAAAVDTATSYVHVEFFILITDDTTEPLFAALERARRRGVSVQVLVDHVSNLMYPNRRATGRRFAEMGAELRLMLPLRPFRKEWQRPDLRNHRKLLVVDGAVGFTGSMNLIAEHYHKKKALRRGLHWDEVMIRITGPAVSELDAVFLTDWYSETDHWPEFSTETVGSAPGADVDAQVVPSGPSFDNDNNLKLFGSLISSAQRRVLVTSPYYVPEESIQMAMIVAAHRGIDVELFVSEVSDQVMVYHAQRSYYEQLLRAGVRIYLYRAPTILHAKHLLIDDDVCVIGTSNLDVRSLSLHMELSVLIRDIG